MRLSPEPPKPTRLRAGFSEGKRRFPQMRHWSAHEKATIRQGEHSPRGGSSLDGDFVVGRTTSPVASSRHTRQRGVPSVADALLRGEVGGDGESVAHGVPLRPLQPNLGGALAR